MFARKGFYMDDEGGGADAGTTSTGEGELPGQTIPAIEEPKPSEIRLNPAQLAERLERARTAERDKLLKEIGFSNPDELKAAITAGKKALDAQKSEQERQQEELKRMQEKSQTWETQARNAEERAQAALMQAEALAIMAGRFANPKAAFRLLDLANVKIDDGGITGIDEAVEKLAKDEPWTLAQPARKTPQNLTTNPPEAGDPTKDSDAEKRKRYFGSIGGDDFFKGGGVRSTK